MWIIPTSLQSSGSLARAETISDSSVFFAACASSLLVRSKRTRSRTWSQKWKRDSWMPLLFGRMCAPSLRTNCAVASAFSSLPILASPSLPPASVSATPILVTSGRGSSKACARCARRAVSSRTSRATCRWDCPQSSAIWKKRVIVLRKVYSARQKSVPATAENASSSWPTARVADGNGSSYQQDRGTKAWSARLSWERRTADPNTWTGRFRIGATPAARDFRTPNQHPDQHPDQLANFVSHSSPLDRDWVAMACSIASSHFTPETLSLLSAAIAQSSPTRLPGVKSSAPHPDLEPALCRMANGLAHRVDRLRLCGNGVAPDTAALAWVTLDAELRRTGH